MTAGGGTCCNQLKVAPLSPRLAAAIQTAFDIIRRFERYHRIEICFVLSRHSADTASAMERSKNTGRQGRATGRSARDASNIFFT